MKKIGLILFIVAAVAGIILAKMFSWGSIPIHLPTISFNNSVKGSGNVITETRDLTGFTSVEVGGAFQVDITAGKEFGVQIQGDDNLVPLISTKVNGKVLEIDTDQRLSMRHRIKLIITAPIIDGLDASGASHFEVTGIDNDSLKIESSGASKIKVSGKTKSLTVDIGGASQVDAGALETENATVNGSGASYSKVNATGELTVDADGASRVRYAGTPKSVNKKTSGVASVGQAD